MVHPLTQSLAGSGVSNFEQPSLVKLRAKASDQSKQRVNITFEQPITTAQYCPACNSHSEMITSIMITIWCGLFCWDSHAAFIALEECNLSFVCVESIRGSSCGLIVLTFSING